MLHPSAFVHPNANVHESAVIGPWCVVDENAEIGENVVLESRVRVYGGVTIKANTHVYDGAILGAPPQDLKYAGEPTHLEIGENCIIREYTTLNRGTVQGGGCTCIAPRVLIMAYAHVGHDCQIGEGAVIANGCQLGGHVRIGKFATLGGTTAVQQRNQVGAYAFVGGTLKVTLSWAVHSRLITTFHLAAVPSGIRSALLPSTSMRFACMLMNFRPNALRFSNAPSANFTVVSARPPKLSKN